MLTNVERCNLSCGTWLLRAKLIARKEQQLHAAIFVLPPQLDESWHLSDVSQAGHIDDKDDLVCETVERKFFACIGAGA